MATFLGTARKRFLLITLGVVIVMLVPYKHLNVVVYQSAASKLVQASLLFMQRGRGVSQHVPALSKTSRDEYEITSPNRKALFIVGHDRSGTTLLNDLFNSDSRIFSVYEPLWVTKYWKNPTRGVLDSLTGIASCRFSATENGRKFLQGISKPEMWRYRRHSNALTLPYFCNFTEQGELQFRNCENLSGNSSYVDDVCLNKFEYSCTKISILRMPHQNCSLLFPRLFHENSNTDIRVLHIVRDPRANINSRLKVTYFEDHPHPIFVPRVRDLCHEVLRDLKFFQKLSDENPGVVKIIRYRDVALAPLKIARDLYKFAGFKWQERVADWIEENTRASDEKLEEGLKHPYGTVRNSTATFEKWKKESPAARVKIIEEICEPLLEELQLDKIAHILEEREAAERRLNQTTTLRY